MKLEIAIGFTTPLRIVSDEAASYPPVITFESGAFSARGENMAATMQTGSYATVSVAWKDKGGNVVEVDATVWESSDPAVCTVTAATGNPLIANLHAPGTVGVCKIMATADADLGEGYKAITAMLDVEVIAGQAVGGEITFTQSPAQGGDGPGSENTPPQAGE